MPELVDESIEAHNPVRFSDAYVNSLDLDALGFTQAVPQETGRPAYAPAAMLKLSLDGYLNKSRSSRTLEPETHRHVE